MLFSLYRVRTAGTEAELYRLQDTFEGPERSAVL